MKSAIPNLRSFYDKWFDSLNEWHLRSFNKNQGWFIRFSKQIRIETRICNFIRGKAKRVWAVTSGQPGNSVCFLSPNSQLPTPKAYQWRSWSVAFSLNLSSTPANLLSPLNSPSIPIFPVSPRLIKIILFFF